MISSIHSGCGNFPGMTAMVKIVQWVVGPTGIFGSVSNNDNFANIASFPFILGCFHALRDKLLLDGSSNSYADMPVSIAKLNSTGRRTTGAMAQLCISY
jgi:hypothetical protein